MTTPFVKAISRTIPAGETHEFASGGAELRIRTIDAATEVMVSMDNGTLFKAAAGEGFAFEHKRFKIKNHNAVPVTVDVRQPTEAGIYTDQRDTATTVQLSGSLAVVNSPFADEGGVVVTMGRSKVENTYDNSASGTPTTYTLITSGLNTNGVFVRTAILRQTLAGLASLNFGGGTYQDGETASELPVLLTQAASEVIHLDKQIYIPPGGTGKLYLNANCKADVYMSWDYI